MEDIIDLRKNSLILSHNQWSETDIDETDIFIFICIVHTNRLGYISHKSTPDLYVEMLY